MLYWHVYKISDMIYEFIEHTNGAGEGEAEGVEVNASADEA